MKISIVNKKLKLSFDGRYENLLCHLFNHKWIYCFDLDSPVKQLRMCPRCKVIQEYKQIPVYGFVWMNLVQRTTSGAKKWIAENNIKE